MIKTTSFSEICFGAATFFSENLMILSRTCSLSSSDNVLDADYEPIKLRTDFCPLMVGTGSEIKSEQAKTMRVK